MQQPGYKCVLAPKLTPSSRFLDCCHHNLTGGSLSTGLYSCCDSSRSTQSHKITIMVASSFGQRCPLRWNLLRKGESRLLRLHVCTLHAPPIGYLKANARGRPTCVRDHLPQQKCCGLRSMSADCESDVVLLLLLEVFEECWQLAFQIFVQPNMDDVYCQPSLLC